MRTPWHPRNKFWKIISLITDSSTTINYPEKRNLLLLHHIALWDVVQQATRNGSLDNAIKNVLPNDLALFIQQHPLLKIIAFNGQKSQQLYDSHFERYPHLTYVTLPSTSPANASQKKEVIFSKWLILKEYL